MQNQKKNIDILVDTRHVTENTEAWRVHFYVEYEIETRSRVLCVFDRSNEWGSVIIIFFLVWFRANLGALKTRSSRSFLNAYRVVVLLLINLYLSFKKGREDRHIRAKARDTFAHKIRK